MGRRFSGLRQARSGSVKIFNPHPDACVIAFTIRSSPRASAWAAPLISRQRSRHKSRPRSPLRCQAPRRSVVFTWKRSKALLTNPPKKQP